MRRPDYSIKAYYRLNFFALLLSMAIGALLISNPFYGAGVYLLADVVKACWIFHLSPLMYRFRRRWIGKLTIVLIILGGLVLAFVYPLYSKNYAACYVSLSAILLELLFTLGDRLLYGRRVPLNLTGAEGKYEKLASYRLFSNMSFYATISINLSVLLLMMVSIERVGLGFNLRAYALLLVWLFAAALLLVLFSLRIRHKFVGLGLFEFIAGAVVWCVGDVMMFRVGAGIPGALWSLLWGLGLVLIASSIQKFHRDFEAVGKLAGEDFDRSELRLSNTVVATAASLASSVIMLLLLACYAFIPLRADSVKLSAWIIQLPLLFMLAAIWCALRQPLDYRNREKLLRYVDDLDAREETKENLKNLLVKKYRMRFGMKIVCTLARPFLRLKVSGLEHLRKERYPSVFVCNHGFIYGPVSAILYLPTYFRPWIHNVMLDPDLAAAELEKSPLRALKKLLGEKLGGKVLRACTKPLLWVLNSFNPIPVVRGASRDVMTTFNMSLQALLEGDNILLFPEQARSNKGSSADVIKAASDLRNFYTGFAHVGKMYCDATGKELLFYPIFSDRGSKSFKIGEPVAYDSSLESRESKRILAEELQKRVLALSGRGSDQAE